MTIIGRYARAEASFIRHHTGDAPAPIPARRPLWKDLIGGALLMVFIGVLVFV